MCAVPNMTVFCSSLTLCFPGKLLTYFLNDFEKVPVAPIITGITFVFTFHMRCVSILRSLCYYYYYRHHNLEDKTLKYYKRVFIMMIRRIAREAGIQLTNISVSPWKDCPLLLNG